MLDPFTKVRTARIEARRSLTHTERHLDAEASLRTWTNIAIGIAVAIGIATVLVHGGTASAGLAAYGGALGLGGVLGFLFGVPSVSRSPVNINTAGSVAVGTGNDSSTIGGSVDTKGPIPKPPTASAQPVAPPGDPANANGPRPNGPSPLVAPPPAATPVTTINTSNVSNLEQVADWVTKLLLGGGLTQLGKIPPKIWQWSRVVALGIQGDRSSTEQVLVAQQAFAAGLLVYGFVLGFFAGFLITKLQLGKAISG